MKKFLLFGDMGTIVHIETTKETPIIDSPPILEINSRFDDYGDAFTFSSHDVRDEFSHIINNVAPIYKRWGDFGPNHDIIVVSQLGDIYKIDYIGRMAYDKPTLAADLLPFIVTPNASYFVGEWKRDKQGNLYKALVGGCVDKCKKGKMRLETRAATAIREAKEEIGLRLKVLARWRKSFKTQPIPNVLSVEANLKGVVSPSVMKLIGTYQTSNNELVYSVEEEANEAMSQKRLLYRRVDETTAFGILLRFEENLTKKQIEGFFEAGDDAEKILVRDIREGVPYFRYKHHRDIYRDTLIVMFR